jgi:nicotinamidase-related amidase
MLSGMKTFSLLAPLLLTAAGCASAAPHASPAPPTTLRARYGLTAPAQIVPARTALVLVDFQEEFFHGGLPIPDGPAALARAAALLDWARASGVAVVHVRNISPREGSPLFAPGSKTTAIMGAVFPHPDELVVTKPTGGAFSRTDLDATLRARGIDTIVVAGIMTHLAVDSTARDGGVLGYHVIVAGDASATRDLPATDGGVAIDHEALHRTALASLADRFADVMTTPSIVALPLVR